MNKRAFRANILSRAEQLLDARKEGQGQGKSDSSLEDGQGQNGESSEEDDGDEDVITSLRGDKHFNSLRHNVRYQNYDDNTSYNSSDDVLSTLK